MLMAAGVETIDANRRGIMKKVRQLDEAVFFIDEFGCQSLGENPVLDA